MLLHGLARGAGSMDDLAGHLRDAGYVVHNVDYPSTQSTPEELVAWLAREEERCCHTGVARLHYVAHSLGGILVRAHLERQKPENLGRVVLLAPPNRGSEWVDVLARLDLFELALGPTAVQLGTDPDSLPNRIGPPDYELGIIAGRRSINPIGSAILPGDDDGTVSVDRTRLEGATDLLVVDANHTFIMQDPEVARQVVWFIERGRFERPGDRASAQVAPTRCPAPRSKEMVRSHACTNEMETDPGSPAPGRRAALQRVGDGSLAAVLFALMVALGLPACGGTRPQDLGEVAGKLRACPESPNCVSSDAEDAAHRIAAIELVGPPEVAFATARQIVSEWPRSEIVSDGLLVMHVECTSAIMRFVDDLELVLRPLRGEIAVRSASRMGYSDMGVNRRRVERLREEMVRKGVARPSGS